MQSSMNTQKHVCACDPDVHAHTAHTRCMHARTPHMVRMHAAYTLLVCGGDKVCSLVLCLLSPFSVSALRYQTRLDMCPTGGPKKIDALKPINIARPTRILCGFRKYGLVGILQRSRAGHDSIEE